MNAIPMDITDDRKTTIVIEGVEYDLVFNARATRKLCEKYGDLDGFTPSCRLGILRVLLA